MSGLGFWKRDFLVLDNDDVYNNDIEYEQDSNSTIIELENLIEELYERIKNDRDYLCIDLFDELTLLSLRDWLANYIPIASKCFTPITYDE
jgi:hypothetical protein